MFQAHLGEIAALITAISGTITALAFEAASKKIGSLAVNFIKLAVAFILIGVITLFTRGMFLPLDASISTWVWLFISGIIGFIVGDFFLFKAYVEIGSRISVLIMATAPPIAAIAGFFILGEKITLLAAAGMLITLVGVSFVILSKNSGDKKVSLSHPIKGILYAFIGACGQAFGLIFGKLGMGSYNPFAASQIRIIAAIIGFSIIITVLKKWGTIFTSLKDFKVMKHIAVGSFFGPFVGVSFSLIAIQHTSTGIASTIMAITPILIIPPSILLFKEKVQLKEITGALITIVGVAFLFM